MIVAVTTPSGTVGGKVAALLLDVEGVHVKLLVRNREKVQHFENSAPSSTKAISRTSSLSPARPGSPMPSSG